MCLKFIDVNYFIITLITGSPEAWEISDSQKVNLFTMLQLLGLFVFLLDIPQPRKEKFIALIPDIAMKSESLHHAVSHTVDYIRLNLTLISLL